MLPRAWKVERHLIQNLYFSLAYTTILSFIILYLEPTILYVVASDRPLSRHNEYEETIFTNAPFVNAKGKNRNKMLRLRLLSAKELSFCGDLSPANTADLKLAAVAEAARYLRDTRRRKHDVLSSHRGCRLAVSSRC